MARVEIWLEILLGEFGLQPDGEFYSDALWVKVALGAPQAATIKGKLDFGTCQNRSKTDLF